MLQGSTGADNYGQKFDGTLPGDMMLSASILIQELKLCAFFRPSEADLFGRMLKWITVQRFDKSDDLKVAYHAMLVGTRNCDGPIIRILAEDRGHLNDGRLAIGVPVGTSPIESLRY